MIQAPASTVREWGLALAALLLTVLVAIVEDWQAVDIVWSMWVSSLVSGYAMILVAIGAGMRRDSAASPGQSPPRPWPALLGGSLFLLAFFSGHFLMFHYVHAAITHGFFPLPGIPEDGQPALPELVHVALGAYWPVVLASLVVRADGFRAATTGDTRKAMTLPYAYVVKNHVMIFIVAGLDAVGLRAYVLYALFAWYFFPFELLRRSRSPA